MPSLGARSPCGRASSNSRTYRTATTGTYVVFNAPQMLTWIEMLSAVAKVREGQVCVDTQARTCTMGLSVFCVIIFMNFRFHNFKALAFISILHSHNYILGVFISTILANYFENYGVNSRLETNLYRSQMLDAALVWIRCCHKCIIITCSRILTILMVTR